MLRFSIHRIYFHKPRDNHPIHPPYYFLSRPIKLNSENPHQSITAKTQIAAPPARLFEFWKLLIDADFHYSTLLVWVKNNMAAGWGDYRGAYENIFYGWKNGATHFWCGARDKSTVFNYDKPPTSDEHPTMKPIELIQEHVSNSTKNSDVVYDPFVGSGTTIVACQNLGRKCRAIEISPEYCAVTLERMETAFPGIEIERITQ